MVLSSSFILRQSSRHLPLFTTLSTAGILLFIVILFLLHLLSPEFAPNTRFISEYALGYYGYLLAIGFVALGLGSIFLVLVLFQLEGTHAIGWKAGLIFIVLWGIGVIMDGIFPIDKGVEPVTISGDPSYGSYDRFSLIDDRLLLSLQFLKKPSFQRIARSSLAIVALIFLLFIWGNLADATIQLLTQRLFVCACLAWLLFVSLYVRLTKTASLPLK